MCNNQKRGSGKQTASKTVRGSVVHPRTASPSVWRTAREVMGRDSLELIVEVL